MNRLCYKGGNLEHKNRFSAKRIFRCVLPSLLILALILPVLLAVPVSADAPLGFSLTSDVDVANAFWKEIDIYSILNSVDSGKLLFLKTSYSSYPWYYLCFNNGRVSTVYGAKLSTTSASYPFLVPETYTSSITSYSFLVNYDYAYSLYLDSAKNYYFFTPDSYIYFDSSSFYCANMGMISKDGTVSYNYTLTTSPAYDFVSYLYSANDPTEYNPIVYPSSAETPTFTTNLPGATHYYSQGVVADPLSVEATVSDGGTLSYEWYESNDTTMTILSTSSSFRPPTVAAGTFSYYCKVTNKVYNPNVEGEYLYATAYSFTDEVIILPAASGSEGSSSTDYSDQLGGIQSGLDDVNQSVTDAADQITDALNPTDPELDQGMSDMQEDMGSINEFEDQHMSDLQENQSVVTDQFAVFQEGSTLLAAFSFVSSILQNTFTSLGVYQVVITLPIALGIFLFICSRTRGADVPRKHNAVENDYLRDTHDREGPSGFRDSVFYDSDRDSSPL